MRLLLDMVYFLTAIAVSPMLVYRMIRHDRYRTGWGQRFGKVARRDPRKRCIWLHAVSMGEVNAAKTLVAEIERQFPDCEIVISTTTDTGYAQADKLFGRKWPVFYFPVRCLVDRAAGIRPPAAVHLPAHGTRSLAQFHLHRPRAAHSRRRPQRPDQRPELLAVSQDQARDPHLLRQDRPGPRPDAGVCRAIPGAGLPRRARARHQFPEVRHGPGRRPRGGRRGPGRAVESRRRRGSGSPAARATTRRRSSSTSTSRSCRMPECDGLRLAVVPRKPERFDEVAQLIEQMGFPMVRYSRLKGTTIRAPGDRQRRDPRRHHGRPAEVLLAGRDHLRGPHARADGRLGHDGGGGPRQVHALRPARVQLPPDGRGPVAGPRAPSK